MESIQTSFNDFIGKEDLNTEFKEFTFHNSGLMMSNHLAETYCQNCQFSFNSNVIFNIERYIRFYIPKYTCAFLNSNINGSLYIGVNDYGFIKGIPYQGELDTEKIKSKIYETVAATIKNNIDYKFDMEKIIQVEIIKVNQPPKPTKVMPQSYTDYVVKKERFIAEYNKFVERMDNWKVRFHFFIQKLVELVNNIESRMMIIEYIRRNDSASSVIKLLETNYMLEYKDHDEINILKEDPSNPYYWVCRWKDEMINMMKEQKPIFDEPDFMHIVPYNLITSSSEMIPFWYHRNPDMNLYMISIKFNTLLSTYGTRVSSKLYFSYLTHDDKNWISCYRNVLPNGEPVCTPY